MKYIYHYHARIEYDTGTQINLDGILRFESPVEKYSQYLEVKKFICEMDKPHFDPKKLTICSLTLLHTIQEDVQPIYK